MRGRILPVLLLFLATLTLSAESETVHTVQVYTSSLIDKDDLTSSSLENVLLWNPEIYFTWPTGDFSISANVRKGLDEEYADVSVDTLKTTVYVSDWFTLEFGKYLYQGSFSTFFPRTAFFRTVDYEKVLTGEYSSADQDAWLIEPSVYLGRWYIRLGLEPYREGAPFFDEDSPWLPDLHIPERLPKRFPQFGYVSLKDVHIEETAPSESIGDAGAALEVGATIGKGDVYLIGFSGLDPELSYDVKFSPFNLEDDYSVTVYPSSKRINALGGGVRYGVLDWVFYGEIAYIEGRMFRTSSISSAEEGNDGWMDTYKTPVVEYTGGVRYENWAYDIITVFEYTNEYRVEAESNSVKPFLNHLAALSLAWQPENFRLYASSIVEMEEYSTALSFGVLRYFFDRRIELGLNMPLFYGDEDTDFGQYKNVYYPTLTFTIKW